MRQHAGRIPDRYPAPRGLGHVDVLVADSKLADDLETGTGRVHHLDVYLVSNHAQHAVDSADLLYQRVSWRRQLVSPYLDLGDGPHHLNGLWENLSCYEYTRLRHLHLSIEWSRFQRSMHDSFQSSAAPAA